MKKDKVKDAFLEQLRKVPIIQVACEKSGISRNSVYRWKNEDPEFEKELETALKEGEDLVNDMSENQLMVLIREKNWHAISFWLRKRNPKFKDRIEVEVAPRQEALTPEQEATVREALRLAGNLPTEQQHHESTKHTSTGTSGENDEGSSSTNNNH
jgi:hypothetical protein